MQTKICVNRLILVIICTVIIGIIIGVGFYCKFIFYDKPSHLHVTTCDITSCQVNETCCDTRYNLYYTLDIVLFTNINGQDYTVHLIYYLENKFSKVCREKAVQCSYDDQDVVKTLNINIFSFGIWRGWYALLACIILVAIPAIICLIVESCRLQLKSEYTEIKDDKDINLEVN